MLSILFTSRKSHWLQISDFTDFEYTAAKLISYGKCQIDYFKKTCRLNTEKVNTTIELCIFEWL